MARKVFFSFHYDGDNWRASQVRNIGTIEGSPACADNDWEEVKKGGDPAIARWISNQMKGRTCTVVLIGQNTANRKWINHEIVESWNAGLGVVGIRIHNLKDRHSNQATMGDNPFDYVNYGNRKLSDIVKVYHPPHLTSTDVYSYISNNIAEWIEEAIEIRGRY